MFKDFGLKKLEVDEAMYYKHDKDGELMGLLSTHVDDFSLAGTAEFLETVTEEVKRTLDISKMLGTPRRSGLIKNLQMIRNLSSPFYNLSDWLIV